MFIYNYITYYWKGKDNPTYRRLYEEMDEFARGVVVMFIMFLAFTFIASDIDGFYNVLFKGGIVSLAVIPVVSMYYSDPKRFDFSKS